MDDSPEDESLIHSAEVAALRRRIAALERRNQRLEEERWLRVGRFEGPDDDAQLQPIPMSVATAEQVRWVAELIHSSGRTASVASSSTTAVSSATYSEARISISPVPSAASQFTSRSVSPPASNCVSTNIRVPEVSPLSAATLRETSSTSVSSASDESQGSSIMVLSAPLLPPVPLAPVGRHRLERFMPLRVFKDEGGATPVGLAVNQSVERSPSMVCCSPSNVSIQEFSTSRRRSMLPDEESSGGFPSDVLRPQPMRPDARLSPPFRLVDGDDGLPEGDALSCTTPLLSSTQSSDLSPHCKLAWGAALAWLLAAEEAGRRALHLEHRAEWLESFEMEAVKKASDALQPMITALLAESRGYRRAQRGKSHPQGGGGAEAHRPPGSPAEVEDILREVGLS